MSCDVGIVGLAVMGSNLALNIASRTKKDGTKFQVAVHNRTWAKTQEFLARAKEEGFDNVSGYETVAEFKDALKKPRRALVLVMAGAPTDKVISDLSQEFEAEDIIVDTGNAHFRDQTRRAEELEAKGLRFLGMGISGGEEGARKGPAFFPGGTLSVWEDIKEVIEAAAAKAGPNKDEPCAVMNGKGGAGSCVKMYHNAGEYAILQIWGEVVAVMRSWGMDAQKQTDVLSSWKTKAAKEGKHENFLSSYMLDITVEVARMKDGPVSGGTADGHQLIERTKDMVGSKGTGLWSVQEALGAGVPAPSLTEAVLARQMTMYRDERLANAKAFGGRPQSAAVAPSEEELGELLDDLFWAAALSIIASYAQMFQCLRVLDKQFDFGLDLPATIATFRAGCILQGYLLTPMTEAFRENKDLSNLICAFAEEITENMPRYKRVVAKVIEDGSAAMPVMLASLSYIQTMCAENLPAGQCVALQRDVFGRHGFKRIDKDGDFNAKWPELQ